jgi:hypothetical protein
MARHAVAGLKLISGRTHDPGESVVKHVEGEREIKFG